MGMFGDMQHCPNPVQGTITFKRLNKMKKIILLMSFIVFTTIAHAINYGSITVYKNGGWSDPIYIKTSIVYDEPRNLITINNEKWGKIILKITSSKSSNGIEYHICRNVKSKKYFVVMITLENNIPYISLSPSEDTIYLFGF